MATVLVLSERLSAGSSLKTYFSQPSQFDLLCLANKVGLRWRCLGTVGIRFWRDILDMPWNLSSGSMSILGMRTLKIDCCECMKSSS
jgi:hypothetical protein